MTMVIFAFGAALCISLGSRPQLLLAWYIWQVRRVEVPENPKETIITYPLA